ncbi:MAG TPA: hypothetical protein VLV89_02155 [Candidatus Acidoferrum sp.]|nr:hypothetical protein [Candidatus Acidoferrum sp.]
MRARYENSDGHASLRGVLPCRASQPVLLGLGLFLMLFPLGCPKKTAPPPLGKNGLIKPPLVMPREADTTPPEMVPPTLSGPIYLNIVKPNPPTVRHAQSAPEPESEPVKHEAPQISPQLSADESARAQASAQENMRVAQKNLDSTNGKRLTANQQDMADKIRGFLKQAQDAMAISDWSRAKSLAEKARLLSDELVKSQRP